MDFEIEDAIFDSTEVSLALEGAMYSKINTKPIQYLAHSESYERDAYFLNTIFDTTHYF